MDRCQFEEGLCRKWNRSNSILMGLLWETQAVFLKTEKVTLTADEIVGTDAGDIRTHCRCGSSSSPR
jgi:hypothetical protein